MNTAPNQHRYTHQHQPEIDPVAEYEDDLMDTLGIIGALDSKAENEPKSKASGENTSPQKEDEEKNTPIVPDLPLYYEAATILFKRLYYDPNFTDLEREITDGHVAIKAIANIGEIKLGLEFNFDQGMTPAELREEFSKWGGDDSFGAYAFNRANKVKAFAYWSEFVWSKKPPVFTEILADTLMAPYSFFHGLIAGEHWRTGNELSGWEKALGFLDVIPGEVLIKAGVTSLIIKIGGTPIDVLPLAAKLKGANLPNNCMVYSKAFMREIAPEIKKSGGKVTHYRIDLTGGQTGALDFNGEVIANNGVHEFIEVITDGKTLIFDNINPTGIRRTEYIKGISGLVRGFDPISGVELLEEFAKKIN